MVDPEMSEGKYIGLSPASQSGILHLGDGCGPTACLAALGLRMLMAHGPACPEVANGDSDMQQSRDIHGPVHAHEMGFDTYTQGPVHAFKGMEN